MSLSQRRHLSQCGFVRVVPLVVFVLLRYLFFNYSFDQLLSSAITLVSAMDVGLRKRGEATNTCP